MAIFVFILALALASGGGVAIGASLDLLPTERGLLYAMAGAVALSASFIVAALGALIVRLDAQTRELVAAALLRDAAPDSYYSPPAAPFEPDPPAQVAAPEPGSDAEPALDEAINENRAGHIPTLHEVEATLAHPEPPARIVGRYSSGGAHYVIFSDGSIEAETDEGQFKFASMDDFRAYVAEQRGN